MSDHFPGSNGDTSAELRLILLGNIGCGKTSSADTILDQQAPMSLTMSRGLVQRQGFCEGRRVTVVEAPRWYWNGGHMDESVRKETEEAMSLLAPGAHAILLLIPVFQFTEMETQVPAELKRLFGEDVLNHTMVLFTCGDYLIGKTVEEYLKKEPSGLSQMIAHCNGICHVLNNRRRQDRMQVQLLLDKVDEIVQRNGIYSIKTAEEREIEKRIQERKQELMESYRIKREVQRQSITTVFNTDDDIKSSVSPVVETLRFKQDPPEDRVEVTRSSWQHSTPVKDPQTENQQLSWSPSYKLNSEGAIPSQTSETASTPKITTSTFHQRLSSSEERSPQVSPTITPRSPVFSSSPASPPAAASAFAFAPDSARSASTSEALSPELRLVLVGRAGSGKSTVGNYILGHEAFRSDRDSLTAVTQDCEKRKAEVCGRKVAVVDTPDWFNSEKTPDEVRAQISSCVTLSSPGPHAFLMCIPVDQPARSEPQALQALGSVFGTDAVQKHTVALFTFADRLQKSGKTKDKSVEAYISSERPDLLKVVEMCRDRFHIMEGDKGESNVSELLETVDQTVREAGGRWYSSPAFEEAEDRVRQRQLEIAREQRGLYKQADLRQLNSERRHLFSYMQPLEEEVMNEEMEKTRDEAEMSVSTMNIKSLPPVLLSNFSPSLLQSLREKMESGMKMLPQMLSDGSVWVGKGAGSVKNSQVWGKVGSGAQSVQKMVADSPVWAKVGASKDQISKAVGGRIPKVVVDGSAWVGSGAKAAAASPV